MDVSQLIPKSYLKATGEVFAGTEGDEDWVKLLAIANVVKDEWASEPGANWSSLYDPNVDCGTVSATDTFDLDDTIRTISTQPGDYVRIKRLDGGYTTYTTVAARQLKKYENRGYVAKVGQTLVFNHTFTADDPEFGGTILVPSYLKLDDLEDSTDDVPVDDPNWLVIMTAAEWVRNDITLAQNFPTLIQEANNLMTAMKRANGAQLETVPLSPVARGTAW